MIQQSQETLVTSSVPDQLYLTVRDVLYAYKEWPDMQEVYTYDFIEGLKRTCTDEVNINIVQEQDSYYFQGYPSGNLIKLF